MKSLPFDIFMNREYRFAPLFGELLKSFSRSFYYGGVVNWHQIFCLNNIGPSDNLLIIIGKIG